MRKSFFFYVFCFAFALSACTTTQTSPSIQASTKVKHGENLISYVTHRHQAKPGNTVAFYPHESAVEHPYRIIGKETISRFNFIGMERQSKTLHELMKSLAASMGGDAVVNISADTQKVEGTVISFEKVLL